MSKSQIENAPSRSGNQAPILVRRIGQSCKALFCSMFITGAILNIALTFILLFSTENYHQVDHIQLYEVFENQKYAETNKLMDREKYLILYGKPSSGIINFVEHEANLRLQEGVPVIMRDLQQSFIHKQVKETKHFVELYLGQVGRGKHSWFIVINNTETPDNQIQSIQKKYPHDSIVLIAHQSLQIDNFKNHKFPVLSSGQLRQFMEQNLKMDKKQIKQIFKNAQDKTAAAIFEAYKNNQEEKVRAQQAQQALTNTNQISSSNVQSQKQAKESSKDKNKQNKKEKKDKQTKKTKKNKKTQQTTQQQDQQPVIVKKQQKVKKQKTTEKKGKNEKKLNEKQQQQQKEENKEEKTKKKAQKIEVEDKKQKKSKKKAEDKQEKAEKSNDKKVKGKKANKGQEKKDEVAKQSGLKMKAKVAVQALVISPSSIINEQPVPTMPIIILSEIDAISPENISIGIQKIGKEVISQVVI